MAGMFAVVVGLRDTARSTLPYGASSNENAVGFFSRNSRRAEPGSDEFFRNS
jgi:hypothetical protein